MSELGIDLLGRRSHTRGMNTDTMYAPETPASVLAAATLAGAKHFGTEMVQASPIAQDRTDQAFVFPIVGHWSSGCAKLGDPILVTVAPDGTITIEVDE